MSGGNLVIHLIYVNIMYNYFENILLIFLSFEKKSRIFHIHYVIYIWYKLINREDKRAITFKDKLNEF